MWGMGAKKQLVNPPKGFNIASRTGIEQPITCRMHPVAVLKILSAYVRRPEGADRTIGTLLGCISEGSTVDITDSFPVVHKDTESEGVLMDQEYHKQMLALHQKVSPRDQVVGWFATNATGNEIISASALIHSYYCTADSQFHATAVLPGPMHVLVDTSLYNQKLGVKAFINVRTVVADGLLQFHEVPLQVQTSLSPAERSGVSQLMQAKKESAIDSIDGFTLGLKELLGLFRRMQEYVKAVQEGKVQGSLAVGRGLTAQLCSEPVIATEAIENLCKTSLQDSLMVVYLSSLTRTQISMTEKIQALYGDVVPQGPPQGFHIDRERPDRDRSQGGRW
jgi:translation initiation factor 3 subunit F